MQNKTSVKSNLCYCFKQDYDELKSPTAIDHSYDKSVDKKKPTLMSSSYAPIDAEPKEVTVISYSFQPDIPKKSPTFDNTSGSCDKVPTYIDTRSSLMVDTALDANIENDPQETIVMMKNYIENVERKAKEKQNRENEEKRKQIQKLMEIYGRKGDDVVVSGDREKMLRELMDQYGGQKRKVEARTLAVPSQHPTESKTLLRKISVSPRIRNEMSESRSYDNRIEIEQRDHDTSEEPVIEKTRSYRRQRPTSLRLNKSYESDNVALSI